MSSFSTWLSSLGVFTKCALGIAVGTTVLSNFQIVSPMHFLLTSDVLKSLQLWRIITASCFFGNFSFPWIMSVGMFVTYMNLNEVYDFAGRPAHFFWFLCWLLALASLAGLALGLYLTSFSLCISLCWTFCRRNASQPIKLYGFVFSAGMFPWALIGFHVLMGNSLVPDIVGALVGHIVLLIFDVLPDAHPMWRSLTTPPRWLENKVNAYTHSASLRGSAGAAYTPVPIRRAAPLGTNTPSSHSWGSGGRKLGGGQ